VRLGSLPIPVRNVTRGCTIIAIIQRPPAFAPSSGDKSGQSALPSSAGEPVHAPEVLSFARVFVISPIERESRDDGETRINYFIPASRTFAFHGAKGTVKVRGNMST